MMYKSCIFDLDGTLTDTLDSLTFSVNLTMKEMGLPEITREQCRMFVGNGSRVLLEKALRAASEEAFERLEEAMEIYGRVFNENCLSGLLERTAHLIPCSFNVPKSCTIPS